MSGYLPTELVLATVDGPVAPVLGSVRNYLRDLHGAMENHCYLVHEPYGPSGVSEIDEPLEATSEEISEAIELGHGVRLDLELRVGAVRHFAQLCLVPAGEPRISFTLKLASSVMDAVHRYDRSLEDFDERAKLGLVELCLGFTRAAGANGFLLLQDEIRLRILTVEEIAQELRARTRAVAMGGVSSSLLPIDELRRIKETRDSDYIYASVTGLTIYDLVLPVRG